MQKYSKILDNILNKIKLLLPYFIKFLENNIIVLKKYLSDCIVER